MTWAVSRPGSVLFGVELDRVDPQQPLVGLDPAQEFVDLGEASLQRQLEADRLVGTEVLGLSGFRSISFSGDDRMWAITCRISSLASAPAGMRPW